MSKIRLSDFKVVGQILLSELTFVNKNKNTIIEIYAFNSFIKNIEPRNSTIEFTIMYIPGSSIFGISGDTDRGVPLSSTI